MKLRASLFSISALFMINGCHTRDLLHSYSIRREVDAKSWKLPELTQSEKEDLVYSVQTVFNDFYVHRTQKKEEYKFDSKAEANQLSVNMPSEELLRKINSIYTNINDYHTVFLYPVPARCVIGGFPLIVKFAYDKNGTEKLIISKKLSKTIESKLANETDQASFAKIQPGDEVLLISNLGIENGPTGTITVSNAISELEKVSMGANDDAAKTRAAQIFFSRKGAFMKPPSGRFELTVKSEEDGLVHTYSFPWLAYESTEDICKADKNQNKIQPNHLQLQTRDSQIVKAQKETEQFFRLTTFEDAYSDEKKENIEKKIIAFKGKKFALIKIYAFVPAKVETSYEENYLQARTHIIDEVNGLREFILNNRDQIEGVIFDVRENGGGYGSFPQLIANAFTSEFVSNMAVQPLVSKMNRDTFHNLEFARFYKRYGTLDPLIDDDGEILLQPISKTADEMDKILNLPDFKNNEYILDPSPRFDEDENDELPPEYNAEYKARDTEIGAPGKYPIKEIFVDKPVAVFTNSHCYSACDEFSSIMKDYKIAKMFGETKHTGGGGANVVEWNKFAEPVVVDAIGTKTPVVPNAHILAKNIRMRFAWNRMVRIKAEDVSEKYIEGGGVLIPDANILKPTINDVLTDGQDALQKIMLDMIVNKSTYFLNR